MGIHSKNLVTAKSIDQVKIEGVKLEWERHDGSVRLLRITDAKGGTVTIKAGPSYTESVIVLVPEPPKMEDRWVLLGEVAGIPIRKAFKHEHEARSAYEEFPAGADLKVEKQVIAVDPHDGEAQADDPIPF